MKIARIVALSVCTSAFVLPVWAEKPEFAGEHKPRWEKEHRQNRSDMDAREQHEAGPVRHGKTENERHQRPVPSSFDGLRFGDQHRESVRRFYAPRVKSGHCPPGLAKKANGCLPPGQARKWAVGQTLPRDLVRYPLPVELQRRLGPPPAGHEYVRVAGDILLLAIGTSMVVDAIEDLGGF